MIEGVQDVKTLMVNNFIQMEENGIQLETLEFRTGKYLVNRGSILKT